jgi:hypothetical protein
VNEVPFLLAVICATERTKLYLWRNWHYRHWVVVTLVLGSLNWVGILYSLFLTCGCGAHPVRYLKGTGTLLPGVKLLRHEADHSHPCSVEVKNGWSCISTLACACMVCTLLLFYGVYWILELELMSLPFHKFMCLMYACYQI